MKEVKHTPGPWAIEPASTQSAKWEEIYSTNRETQICEISLCTHISLQGNGVMDESDKKEEAEANARLIASAPELLSEMLRYLPVLEALEKNEPDMWAFLTQGTGIATLNGYRNAITKATGGQP
jgi:hypothetical protein